MEIEIEMRRGIEIRREMKMRREIEMRRDRGAPSILFQFSKKKSGMSGLFVFCFETVKSSCVARAGDA